MKILEILQRIYMWTVTAFVASSFIFEGQFVINLVPSLSKHTYAKETK